MRYTLELPAEKLTIVPWPDPVLKPERFHDARSSYVERFWLGTLGPSTMFLLRHLVDELEDKPTGFVLHYADAGAQLGIKGTGKNSPLARSLMRLEYFNVARMITPNRMAVRALLPTLSRALQGKLSPALMQRHQYHLEQLRNAAKSSPPAMSA